jgi:hypothetical protein
MNLFHKLAMAGSGSSGGSSSGATDPYLNQTSLLLHGDGTNGAQNNTLVDSSTNNLTFTRTGDGSLGTFTPFSHDTNYWSTYYPTNTQRTYATMSTSIINVTSTATFTVEGWIMITASASGGMMLATTDFGSTVNWYVGIDSTTNKPVIYWYTGAVVTCLGSTVLNYYQWYFVQFRCNNGALSIGVNGVAETLTGTTTMGNPGNSTYLSFGAERSFNHPCYLYDVRISNTVRSYTLPTQPQSTDANTTFLGLRKKTYTDESSLATTLTNVGISNPFSPFGTGRTTPYTALVVGGSLWMDGTSDYYDGTGSASLAFGTGDFAIEFWMYLQVIGTYMFFYDARPTGTNGAYVCIYKHIDNTLRYYVNSLDQIASTTLAAGVWYHVVVSRVSGSTRMFLNGVQQTTVYSDSTNYLNPASRPRIGDSGNALGNPLSGYISGYRVLTGTGYTSVTVPTAPPTAISGTQLLLNFTSGGIIDSTGRQTVETVSTANINTTIKKFGTGSMKFNGSSDYLYLPMLPNHRVLNILGDFTVEFWFYVTSIPDCCFFQLAGDSGSVSALRLNLYTTGALTLLSSTTGAAWNINVSTSAGAVVINTWYHVAIVRNSGTFTVYQNGASVITSTAIAASTSLYAGTLNYIACINNGGATYFIPGYIDEFRITRGVARYTAPFTSTVPTAAFGDK